MRRSGCYHAEFLSIGMAINYETYIQTLKKLKGRIRRVRPHLEMDRVLFHHENARPQISAVTVKTIAAFGWETLPHPGCWPDLASSDFHLSPHLTYPVVCLTVGALHDLATSLLHPSLLDTRNRSCSRVLKHFKWTVSIFHVNSQRIEIWTF